MIKKFYLILFLLTPVQAGEFDVDEYFGINEAISNSRAYKIEYANTKLIHSSLIGVTSQLYSSDDGYFLIPQNFAARIITNFEGTNWNVQFGVLRWSRSNSAFYHKTSYELSFGLYIADIELRLNQYTDQYQRSKNFNLTSIYFYKEY